MTVLRKISIVLLCCFMASLFMSCISSTTSSKDIVNQYEPSDHERDTDKWVMEMKFVRAQGKTPVTKLRSGDSIEVFLRGIPEEIHVQDVVDHGGFLNLPYVGRIKIAGKTSSEVELDIEDAYIDGEIFNHVSVIVVTPQDEFFVRGEVERPGKFPITGETTLSQAVATAGDFTDYSNRRDIIIRRKGRSYKYDMNKIDKGEQNDPYIMPGDIIVVGRRLV
jgi:polysaccharide export outer membrane protein